MKTSLVFAAIAAVSHAAPVSTLFGWTQSPSLVEPSSLTKVTIAVVHPEGAKEKLSQVFHDVSYGGSKFTEYWTRDQLATLMAPKQDSLAQVFEWCNSNSLDCTLTGTGDLVRAAGSVSAMEQALNTKLASFEHPEAIAPIVRSSTPVGIPSDLKGHVDIIHGLDSFPTIFTMTGKIEGVEEGAPQVTPALLKGATLYNITDVASATSMASMAVAEFQGQSFLPSDLAKFESSENLPAQPVRHVLGGNPTADKNAQTESSLDIQYVIATGTGVPADFWLEKDQAFDLLGWAGEILNETSPALVWSVSYGEGVNGGINGVVPVETVHRLNMEMQKFGAMGMTVFIASGDSGVYSREPVDTEFHPSFPACLPAVTAVGATQLNADGSEDTAVSFSGGGFTPASYYTSAADAGWQNKSVANYLASDITFPPQKDWDRTGRGIPDVSAVGVDFVVYQNGRAAGVSGTSASTPAVAGIFALVNDQLMAAGKKPMGFANPFIYDHPGAFRDIQKGYNNGGGIAIFKKGFYATIGWDPVTGMGTPNYPALKAAAMAAQE